MKTNVMLDLIQDNIFAEYDLMFDEKLKKLEKSNSVDFIEDMKEELIPIMQKGMPTLKYESLGYKKLMHLIRIEIKFDEFIDKVVKTVVSELDEDVNYTLLLNEAMVDYFESEYNNIEEDSELNYRCYILFKILSIKYNLELELSDLFGEVQLCYDQDILDTINALFKSRATIDRVVGMLVLQQSKEYLDYLHKCIMKIELSYDEGLIYQYEDEIFGVTDVK